MGNTHKRYAAEYRRRMVELVRAGRQAEELAREFQAFLFGESLGLFAEIHDPAADGI